jgi:AraC-like DNA-binding protein
MTAVERVVAYIHENLGEKPDVKRWQDDGSLPLYLREPYEYRFGTIHGRDVILMIVRVPEPPSPGVIAKHSGVIRDRTALEPIVVFSALSSYNRKRLVERGVSFIVPGNQMYLAPLGIDFREHSRKSSPEVQTVQPATQRTIIALLSPDLREDEYSPSDLAEKLGYSTMTLSRVFKELEAISFGSQITAGRKRLLRLSGGDRRALWNHALPYLSTPVKRTETIVNLKKPDAELPLSGISALAWQSDLAEPSHRTVAANESQWRRMYSHGAVQVVPPTEETATLVEIWKYPPQRWGQTVDPLSLYLSLRASPDERIQGALELLLERFPW